MIADRMKAKIEKIQRIFTLLLVLMNDLIVEKPSK